MLSEILLRNRLGQALMFLGILTTFMCFWTAQHEWVYHASDSDEDHRIKHLKRSKSKEGVIVNALLDVIHRQVEEDSEIDINKNIISHGGPPSPIQNNYKRNFRELCPLYPSDNLVGRLAGSKDCITPEEVAINHPYVEVGGRVRPKNCTAVEKVAIIIPFRNRYTHLYILLNNLIPFLRRQLIDARFFVIEQTLPTTFNRGALFNVGFLEALKFDSFDCFIFHDVDLIPMDDRNLYRCDEQPMHFAVAMDKYKYMLPYKNYFGGVVGLTRKQYLHINGNSNMYFGWGGEDDDLFQRIQNKNYEIARPYQDIGRYDMIRHFGDSGNEDNCDRLSLLKSAAQRQDQEGLNTIKYQKMAVKIQSHVTWVSVYLDMAEVIDTAPDYVKEQMALVRANKQGKLCNFTRGTNRKA